MAGLSGRGLLRPKNFGRYYSNTTQVEGIDMSMHGNTRLMKLNRPKRLNAFTMTMFNSMPDLLQEAAEDNETKILLLTGEGSYYSSGKYHNKLPGLEMKWPVFNSNILCVITLLGNDLGNFAKITPDTIKEFASNARENLEKFVSAFIDFPKPIMAAVNGPAMGIGCTTLAFCDAVYCSERATFSTPFMKVGQSPEGCSRLKFCSYFLELVKVT